MESNPLPAPHGLHIQNQSLKHAITQYMWYNRRKKGDSSLSSFPSDEKESDCIWALDQLMQIMAKESINMPLSIVIDRELALMMAIEKYFHQYLTYSIDGMLM